MAISSRELDQYEIDNRLYHEIHVSQIREYKKCAWAHDWKYKDQLYPNVVAKPLEFGTAMHLGFEYLMNPQYKDASLSIVLPLAKSAFITECKKQRDAVPQNIFMTRDELTDEYQSRIELGQRMLEYYAFEIKPIVDKDTEPLYVEKNFIVPIPGVTKCVCYQCFSRWEKYLDNMSDEQYAEYWKGSRFPTDSELFDRFKGLPVVLEGKIDLILKDKNTGKVWVRDWKNVNSLSSDYEWLENDEQLNLYLMALWLLGLDIAGFQYFELKKAVPGPPKKLTRKYAGKWFSTDKNQDTTFEIFVETLRAADEPFEPYIEYLEFLKERGTDHYFRLNKVRRDAKAMRMQYTNLVAVVSEMIERPKYYPTPTKFGCKFCEFRAPCIERMQDNDPQGLLDVSFTKKPHYYEVRDNEMKYAL